MILSKSEIDELVYGEGNLARLNLIKSIDPEWANMIMSFVDKFPEFYPYIYMAAITRKAVFDVKLNTVKEMLIYYVCHAGVKNSYGDMLWEKVKEKDYTKIPLKKKETILEILKLNEKDLSTPEAIEKINISGVGYGAKKFVLSQRFDDLNTIDYTDRIFQNGLIKLYSLPKRPTPTQARKLTERWKETGIAGVGNMFVFAISHYT
jgi:predicted nucleotidyltransferase